MGDLQDNLEEKADQIKEGVKNLGNDIMDKAQDVLNSDSFAPNIQVHISLDSYFIFKAQIPFIF